MYVALDVEYIDGNIFTEVSNLAKEVGRLIGGLRAAVSRQKGK